MEYCDRPAEAGAQHVLIVFRLSDRLGAFRREEVERIAPMAELSMPPGMPSALEGILNLAGVAIPVLRLDRMVGLPAGEPGLYSMVVIPRGQGEARIGFLVDRVNEVVTVPESEFLPIGTEDSWNGCAEATVTIGGNPVALLSPARLLLAKERAVLREFQHLAERRLESWRAGAA